MSMIFNFRMISDENDHFVRDYEVPYDMTLKEFHTFICDDLKYDPFEMSSFFKSDGSWQKLQEYTLIDMGIDANNTAVYIDEDEEIKDDFTPLSMENTYLGQIIKKKNDRLLFVFDILEDRLFFIELINTKKADKGVEYPRVMFYNGDAPDQFDVDKSPENKSIFDEAMDDWGEFDGDDQYDDEY